MKTRKTTLTAFSALAALFLTAGCAESVIVASTLVAPTAATGASALMAMKTGETMRTTKWYDGIERFDNQDAEAIRYARLQDAAREIESRMGVKVSPEEVDVLATLYRARNADLETFAKDRRLTRAQIDEALKMLRKKGLITVIDQPGRPGGFVAMATPKATALGDPMQLGRDPGESPPVFVMNAAGEGR
ncbi:MAG: hypothetical protein KIT79_13150 [Deltaproteobacteria bacterium]|nr:hypothetical protein [Deltaproteobacteria bacterium]